MDHEPKRPADRGQESGVLGGAGALRKPRKERGMNKRRQLTLAVLAVVAGLAVAGVLLADRIRPEQAETQPPANTTRKLVDRTIADLAEITVQTAEGGYTLIPVGDDEYRMKDSPDFAVDPSKARSLASACASILYDDAVNEPGDLEVYGLDDPSATVEIVFADGTARVFILGDKAPSGLRYYLMEKGLPDVYFAYPSVGAAWTRTRVEMHVALLPQITAEEIVRASLTGMGIETIIVGYEPERKSLGISGLWITSPVEYTANAESVDEYFRDIAAIEIIGFVDKADGETLAQYGLDAPRYHLIAYGENDAGRRSPIRALRIGGDCGADAVYALIDDTTDVYTIRRDSVAFLASISTARLIDRFSNIINIANVDRIYVVGGGVEETLEIERVPELDANGDPMPGQDGNQVSAEAFRIGGEPADDKTFRKLYQLVIGTLADGILPAGWAPADDAEPVLSVTYRLTEGRADEVIEYLLYNAEHYAVRRNGVCLFYILKSRVDVIPEAFAAYHDGSFDPKNFGL
ncbi:MAG: DUF4340 domain-containing protein [Clostridia bacterium]|nr:DUF4340 domain-containing protein [Clostridia bacterium]